MKGRDWGVRCTPVQSSPSLGLGAGTYMQPVKNGRAYSIYIDRDRGGFRTASASVHGC